MKYKSYIVSTLVAALLCVASILYLAKEITAAGHRIHSVGAMRLVNFSFKTGRNFDELANALIDYRDCRVNPGQLPPGASNKTYVQKFDIVWSAFKNAYGSIYRHWSSTDYWLDERRAVSASMLRDSGLAFLTKYEIDMSPQGSVSCSRINEMLSDIYSQKELISEFAQSYFEIDNKAAHEQQNTIENLFATILVLGGSFSMAALVTIALVHNALKEAAESTSKSRLAEQQAMAALVNLRESIDKNVAQKQFFAAASHDLRQPLHALGLYIGSMQKHVESEEALHILKCANLSADSLSALIDSLLDISKLDAGVIESNKSDFEIANLLSRLRDRFLPEAEEKGLEFICKSDDVAVYTDNHLLDRMLQNLIVNALSYTDTGYIEISAKQSGEYVLLTVKDTGSGIPELKQEAVFDEFYRLDQSRQDRERGLGLGLSIVKRLSELLQVKLDMKSAEGVGTSFTITLPLSGKPHIKASNLNTGSVSTNMPEKLKILVIDDEEEVRESTAIALQSRGCIVRVAEDTAMATVLCKKQFSPDLIVSDYRLQEHSNGIDAIKSVRRVLGKEVPALLITGDTTVNFIERRSIANTDILYKPVDSRQLFERIAKLATATMQKPVINS